MPGKKITKQDVERWLAEHGDYLFRYAMLRLRNEELARDIVQEPCWRDGRRVRGFGPIHL
jgi:hypothetical protein